MLGDSSEFILMVMEIRKALFEKVAFELWSEGWRGCSRNKGRKNIQDSDDSIYKGPAAAAESLSRVRLCATPQTAAHQAPHPWDSPGKSNGVGCHRLLWQRLCGRRVYGTRFQKTNVSRAWRTSESIRYNEARGGGKGVTGRTTDFSLYSKSEVKKINGVLKTETESVTWSDSQQSHVHTEKLNYVQGILLMNAWNYGSCTHFNVSIKTTVLHPWKILVT